MGAGSGAYLWGTNSRGTRVWIQLQLPGPSNLAGVQSDSWALRVAAGPKLAL